MPPRRPRRGGIHTPWQDAQLKEAEELLNNLTGAADMTTAEIQRTLRAPRLDALPRRPEVSRRRNVPELGGIDALRLAAGEPARLMGYPVLICEDMPDIAAGAKAIAFGDFGAGYTIAERPDLRVLRDPFSAKPHVLFYATKRVGGDVTDFSAIKLLQFSAS